MKAVILAGGLGTRLREETDIKPKPMVEIGGKPILWHIMKTYAQYGVTDFVICAGYKQEVIRNWLANYEILSSDFTITIGQQKEINFTNDISEAGWTITLADTGLETMTGGRVNKIKKYVGNEPFFCTYGDGVATLTAVNPVSRFGVIDINENSSIDHFREKPKSDGWINAGYFVFEPEIFDYLTDDSILEQDPLAQLANRNKLFAYKHEGFWQPMDTYREFKILNDLWDEQQAPWRVWN